MGLGTALQQVIKFLIYGSEILHTSPPLSIWLLHILLGIALVNAKGYISHFIDILVR